MCAFITIQCLALVSSNAALLSRQERDATEEQRAKSRRVPDYRPGVCPLALMQLAKASPLLPIPAKAALRSHSTVSLL